MKRKLNFKRLAAALAVAAGVASVPALLSADELVKVLDKSGNNLGVYSAGDVSKIVFATDGIAPVADSYSEIIIPLSDKIQFTMVKVKGCDAYTLTNLGQALTAGDWAVGTGATKKIDDFWIGKFEVTQGVWREVMGSVPANQTAQGDFYPVARVSWNDICTDTEGQDCFLTLLNKRLDELKEVDSSLAKAIGDNLVFRLPNEWEWEYAAAGGANYKTLNYYFSGTADANALGEVAVGKKADPQTTNVARVGSKLPNALWLYDMSGNVWEWCSGTDYPGHTGFTDPEKNIGYLANNGTFNPDIRPRRGGGLNTEDMREFRLRYRSMGTDYATLANNHIGFRLVLGKSN